MHAAATAVDEPPLRWYVVRKAAVLEAGGSMDDVLAACCDTGSLQAAYPCLLLWVRLSGVLWSSRGLQAVRLLCLSR